MKKRRLKIKKKVKNLFVIFVIVIVGIIFGIRKYNEYKYKQTNEYKLTVVGYTLEESKLLISKLNDKNEKYFVDNEKNDYVIDLIKEKYFLEKNLFDYLEYRKDNKKKSFNDIVAIVNVGANNEWYDNDSVKPTDMDKGNLILVNKFNYLSSDFIPSDLTSVSLSYAYEGQKAIKEVVDAYHDMASNAKEADIQLLVNSSFRDYQKQESVYKDFYYSNGISYADKYAARAGYSEHQTGLCLDIFTSGESNTENFDETKAFEWLSKNAHKYGFILRYPKAKEYLTGYEYESWHYRYLGKEVATKVYESGLTYDEYYAFYLDK